jgi:hypothetical protein
VWGNVNVAAIVANVAAILVAFGAIWRFGRSTFRRAIHDEAEPALSALRKQSETTVVVAQQLAKRVAKHAKRDEAKFNLILERLSTIETQGVDAAAKVEALAK